MDLISSHTALSAVGMIGCVGNVGMGGGLEFIIKGGALPNRRKGRLKSNKRMPTNNCEIKIRIWNKNPKSIPKTEKNPRLSPAGKRLTKIARPKRKNKLYSAHCLGKLLEEIGMRRRFQCVCKDINRLRLSNAKPNIK